TPPPTPSQPDRRSRAHWSPAPAVPPCPESAHRHPTPVPRTARRRDATRPGFPTHLPLPYAPERPVPAAGPAGRRGHSRRRRFRRRSHALIPALGTALLRQLVQESHQLVRQGRRHAGHAGHVIALEIENVLQRLLAVLLQYRDQFGREALHLAQRDFHGLLLFGRQRREERALTTTLEPLTARVEVDLPTGELRRQPDVLSVAADGEGQLVLVDNSLNGLRVGVREH